MMVDALRELLQGLFGSVFPLVWTLLKIVLIIAPLLLCVAYLTFWERKVIGWMQVRIGPNRVGPWGLIQPIADGLKLFLKEVVVPTGSDKSVFVIAPMFAFAPALAAWAVVPFNDTLVLANVNASLLYVMAISSIGVYGIILAGWASNSKYAFLGGMRSAAQMISYEISMGLALVVVLMVSNSLNLGDIVNGQGQGYFAEMGLGFLSWNWLPLLPMFVVYLVSIVAETNRAPFDIVPKAKSEIVAGFHMVEYSGMAFRRFLPGRIRQHDPGVDPGLECCSSAAGCRRSASCPTASSGCCSRFPRSILFFFLWIRVHLPRAIRYDQIMRLGWKVFIPLCPDLAICRGRLLDDVAAERSGT
jgi:NADH-quinone oxidoreductase subunit H